MFHIFQKQHIRDILDVLAIWSILGMTYTPFIKELGIYWDSWRYLNRWRNNGAQAFIDWQSTERPILGYVFATSHALLGYSPYVWHVTMFIMYALSISLIFHNLKLIFKLPNQQFLAFSFVIIYALYPSYLLHNDAISLQVVTIAHFFFSISLFCMNVVILPSFSIKQWIRVIAFGFSLFLQIFIVGIYEGFIVLEVFRVLLIWYVIIVPVQHKKWRSIFKAIFQKWYLWLLHVLTATTLLMVNLSVASGRGTQTDITSYIDTGSPIDFISNLLIQVTYHGFQNLVNAWIAPLNTLFVDMPLLYRPHIVLLFASSIAVSTLVYSMVRFNVDQRYTIPPKDGIILLIIGISLLGLGVFPVSIIGQYLQLEWFVFTRWYIFATFGSALICATILHLLLRPISIQITLSVLVGLASLTHLSMASHLAYTWQTEKEYWWQLNWRIPDLESETLVVFVTRKYPKLQTMFTLEDASFKLIYSPQNQDVFLSEVYTQEGIIEHPHIYENVIANLIEDQTVIVSAPYDGGCLRVLDAQRNELPNRPERDILAGLIPFSNPHQILKEPQTQLIPEIFGAENKNTWCYFFERADLFRTLEQDEEVIKVYQTIIEQNLTPVDTTEWMPFVEALAVNRNFHEAHRLLQLVPIDISYVKVISCGITHSANRISMMNCLSNAQ